MNQVVERAAEHVAKLFSGELSEADLRALEAWLAEDVRHRVEYEAMLETWDLVEDGTFDAGLDFDSQEELAEPQRRAPRYKIAVGFSAILVALSAYIFVETGWDRNTFPGIEYETVVGEQRTVHLEDDSTVTLNTGTKIQVDFSDGKRHLSLAFGEAYFDIAKDPSRPFVIDIGDRQITVLGTQFNVHLAASASIISVIEGLVSVRDSDPSDEPSPPEALAEIDAYSRSASSLVMLKAGKSASFSVRDTVTDVVVETGLDEFRDWRRGQVRFDSESLIKVVAELNRYSNHKVLIEDSTIVELEVSGVFQLDKFDQFLQGLDEVLPVDVVHYSDRYVIVGSGRQAKFIGKSVLPEVRTSH